MDKFKQTHTNKQNDKPGHQSTQIWTPYLDLFVQLLLEGSPSLLQELDPTLFGEVNDLLPVVSELLHLLPLGAGQAQLVASDQTRTMQQIILKLSFMC